jgi:hypothetical protein
MSCSAKTGQQRHTLAARGGTNLEDPAKAGHRAEAAVECAVRVAAVAALGVRLPGLREVVVARAELAVRDAREEAREADCAVRSAGVQWRRTGGLTGAAAVGAAAEAVLPLAGAVGVALHAGVEGGVHAHAGLHAGLDHDLLLLVAVRHLGVKGWVVVKVNGWAGATKVKIKRRAHALRCERRVS